MKKLILTALVAFTLSLCSMAKANLVDVDPNHWAADAIQKLEDSGIVIGYPDKTFRGDRSMTRYEYAMVVARLMTWIDQHYCTPDECKSEPKTGPGPDVTGFVKVEDLDEVKDIIKKLSAEFKDELAALKAQVDKNTKDIAGLSDRLDNLPGSNFVFSGLVRQRIDVVDSDLDAGRVSGLFQSFYGLGAVGNFTAGYEMKPEIQLDNSANMKDTEWSIRLSQTIANQAITSPNDGSPIDLDIKHAYVGLDLTNDVKELDLLKVRAGYQPVQFGPYGALVDNTGVDSTVGVKVDVGKDILTLTAFGGLIRDLGTNAVSGLGSAAKDPYGAARVTLDLNPVVIGGNALIDGVGKEKGWGVDVTADLLKNSPFLKQVRAEYLKMTDNNSGTVIAAGSDDSSIMLGVDLYKSKRAGLTLGYADIPALPGFTGVDLNPLTEYDASCPLIGLDVGGGIDANGDGIEDGSICASREDSTNPFPSGFKGITVDASYIVWGDVELAASAVVGDVAGGTIPAGFGAFAGTDATRLTYPGYGKVSVTKPVTKNAKFKVEYFQQGKDPIIFNRIRSELMINF